MDSNIYVYINGVKTSLLSLAASSGISYATILARYKAGVAPESLTAGAKAVLDTTPTNGSTNGITSGAVFQAIQDAKITLDTAPTQDSANGITSGATFTALAGKQATLEYSTGTVTNGTNVTTSFILDKFGRVAHLTNFMSVSGSIANGATLFTLPSGFRPASTCRTYIVSNDEASFRWVRIDANTGAVTNDGTAIPSGKYFAIDTTFITN